MAAARSVVHGRGGALSLAERGGAPGALQTQPRQLTQSTCRYIALLTSLLSTKKT